MKKYVCFIMLLLCSFTTDDGFRTIDNKLYSISIPSTWVPMQGMPGDGTNPGERDLSDKLHVFYWAWQVPVKSKEEIPKCVGIDIQSYQRTDNKELTVDEMVPLEMSRVYSITAVKKTDMRSPKNQKRFFLIKDGKEMNGESVVYRVYYLFQQSGNIVHCITISLRDELAQQPGKKEEIEKIMDSFKAKK